MPELKRDNAAKTFRKSITMLFLAAQIGDIKAAEDEPASQAQNAAPDIELLEFLGSFQTDNGEWVEPASLLTEEFTELLNLAARMDAASNSGTGTNDDNQQDNQQ